jgi:hypothetical protein
MAQDSLRALPFALQCFWLCLIILGFVRLLRRRSTGQRATTVTRRRGFAIGAIVLGFIGLSITSKLTVPPWRRLPGRHSPDLDAPATITNDLFDSHGLPAVHLEAPQGWRIAFDSTNQAVLAIKGSAPADVAPMVFRISSARTSDEADANRMLDTASKVIEERGFAVGESFVDTVDGLRATGRVLRDATEHTCLWFVKRGTHFTSALLCTDRSSGTDCAACKRVLERLEWRD